MSLTCHFGIIAEIGNNILNIPLSGLDTEMNTALAVKYSLTHKSPSGNISDMLKFGKVII
jgi:hypothetical protein